MKCPHCKKAPYPIKNEDGSWNKKNLLKVDWYTVVAVLILIFLAWGYRQDMEQCFELTENPRDYCAPICNEGAWSNPFAAQGDLIINSDAWGNNSIT